MKNTVQTKLLLSLMLLLFGLHNKIHAQQIYGQVDALRGNSGIETDGQISSNGVPSITIPLLSAFPVSLSYDASGIKPDHRISSVGLGWSLQAGGEITRVVHGLRDEISGMHPAGITTAQAQAWQAMGSNPQPASQKTVIGNMMYAINNSKLDTAPDEFRYHILGRSGTFLFKPDGTIIADRKIKVKVSIDASNLVFSHYDARINDDAATITGITITFEDGMICSFRERIFQTHELLDVSSSAPIRDIATNLNTWL